MLFTIIIPSWDRRAETERLLAAIEPCLTHYPGMFEVIVIDYDTADPADYGHGAHTISVTTHPYQYRPGKSAAHARNIGATLASGDWLVFLDADLVPARQCMDAIIEHLSANADPNVIYGAIRFRLSQSGSQLAQDPASLDFKEAYGYCQIIHRNAFNKLGGYNEGYYGWNEEDLDLCRRALKAGMDVRFIQRAHFYHPWHTEMSWKPTTPATPNSTEEDGYTMLQDATQYEYDRAKYLRMIHTLEQDNQNLFTKLEQARERLAALEPVIVEHVVQDDPPPAKPPIPRSVWRRLGGWFSSVEGSTDPR